ncbi:MAG TPA: hypothetical protein DCM40_36620, partial [Maribacter sp.]|nr:hypothetical protein [Maribacter sp.]
MAKKRDEISKESAKAASDVAKAYEDGLITLKQQDVILDKILKKQLRGETAINKALTQAEKQKDIALGQEKIEERRIALKDKEVDRQKEIKDLSENLLSQNKEILGAQSNIFKLSSDEVDQQKELVKQKIRQIQELQKGVDGRTKEGIVLRDQLAMAKAMENQLQRQGDLIGTAQYERMQGAFQDASDKAAELGGHLDDFFAKLPGGG